jgi:hypothetical protein
MEHKLGVIVPYRNRPQHLEIFKDAITAHLNKQNINYEIFIVDQDNGKQFNRGMLLNIGFKYAIKSRCDYVVFHDVDMLPIDVDYSYSDKPLHLATDFKLEIGEKKRETFDEYFGGVTLFPVDIFKKINGYSNRYWAWGYEDTDLLFRCKENGIDLDTMLIRNFGKKGKTLKFNGVDAYVVGKNNININNNTTIFISFHPDKLILDHKRPTDEFTVFSLPGWDYAICYSSFSRYNFCCFDTSHNALFVNSNIKPNYMTNMVIVNDITNKVIKVYQDGEFIGQTPEFKKLYFYKKEPNFYLGVGKPDRKDIPNFFRGTIQSFAYYDELLNEDEIKEISHNEEKLLNENFGNYKSANDLKIYYDANHIDNYALTDLTGNGNHGYIKKCVIEKNKFKPYTEVKIPYRRKSLFKSLVHEENGFLGDRWKDQATRWNQLRFHNEISLNRDLVLNDGLIDLKYTEHGKEKTNKITHINVGL